MKSEASERAVCSFWVGVWSLFQQTSLCAGLCFSLNRIAAIILYPLSNVPQVRE